MNVLENYPLLKMEMPKVNIKFKAVWVYFWWLKISTVDTFESYVYFETIFEIIIFVREKLLEL